MADLAIALGESDNQAARLVLRDRGRKDGILTVEVHGRLVGFARDAYEALHLDAVYAALPAAGRKRLLELREVTAGELGEKMDPVDKIEETFAEGGGT